MVTECDPDFGTELEREWVEVEVTECDFVRDFDSELERELMRTFLQRKERERDQSQQKAAEDAALDHLPREQADRVRQRADYIETLIDQAKRGDVEAAKRLVGIVAEHRIRAEDPDFHPIVESLVREAGGLFSREAR